jgi:PBP1b-binding outer membrane lipoprotein LpoB
MEKHHRKILAILCFIFIQIFLSSCSSSYENAKPTLEFEDKNSIIFTTVAYAGDDLTASNNAMIDAIKVCKGTRNDIILLDYSVRYQGYNPEEKKLINTSNKENKDLKKLPTKTATDYKAVIKFKCRWPEKKTLDDFGQPINQNK